MLNYILIPIFYLLFIYLALKNTKWGVYLIVALLPTYLIRFTILGIPTTLLEGMIWLLFIIWLVKLKKEKGLTFNPIIWIKNIYKLRVTSYELRNPIPKALRLPLILFLIASTFAVFVSPNFRAASGLWKAYFIVPMLFFIIFIYTIKTFDDLKKVIRFLGLIAIAIGIFAVIQKFTGILIPNPFWADEATRRVTTFFGYPNANALLLAPIVFLTLGNLIDDLRAKVFSFKFLVLNLLAIILGILTIIWTQSTGATIALIVGLIFLLIFYKKTRLIALSIILILSIGLTFSTEVQRVITNKLTVVSETHLPLDASDLHMRVQQWRETISMLSDTPIFGPGLAGYQSLMIPYHQNSHVEIYLYPHNFFLNFWTETGLLGLISTIWILVLFFILGFKAYNKSNIQIFKYSNNPLTLTTTCAMIVLLVHGLVDVPYFKNDLSILFWIIVGLMIILYNERRSGRAV